MNIKHWLIIIAVSIICFTLGMITRATNVLGDTGLTEHEQQVIAWHLGDDITPYPIELDNRPCRTSTIYCYLFLHNMGYNPKIKKGPSPWIKGQSHVWVETDNYIYEAGIALPKLRMYQGDVITWSDLLFWAWQK